MHRHEHFTRREISQFRGLYLPCALSVHGELVVYSSRTGTNVMVIEWRLLHRLNAQV